LNPPFSRKDKRTYPVQVDGEASNASVALTFIVHSLQFLRPSGSILAVLPDGCLVGLHDRPVWGSLERLFKVEVIRDNARSAFCGVRARTCLVRMTRLDKEATSEPRKATVPTAAPVDVVRGLCQMHSRIKARGRSGASLVHTSHMRSGTIVDSGERVEGKVVAGPALLFPRVGLVTPEKLCTLGAGRQVVLSDCVLGVECGSEADVQSLRRRILASWPTFASGYRGTGAPYITVQRAATILAMLKREGVAATESPQSEMVG
jgi:hypothetical protein